MDVYGGVSAPDYFRIDDLLDFSDDQLFSAAASPSYASDNLLPPPPTFSAALPFAFTNDFTDPLALPSDDVAELEWLSRFVDDSFSDIPPNLTSGTINIHSITNSRTPKRPKSSPPPQTAEVRRCTHCASEKTPQWRTGPLGPKTLCNACGVRYKSGRLVPEYRPAASPTFVLTQHSNSHRKVLELRRQKELVKQQQHNRDFRVC